MDGYACPICLWDLKIADTGEGNVVRLDSSYSNTSGLNPPPSAQDVFAGNY